jgi:membrane protein
LFGPATAGILMTAMQSSQTGDGMVAATVSVVTLLVGATTVFSALEAALQQIWGARKLVPAGIRGWVRSRLLSFGLILAVGFLLLVSLSVSTALSALRGYLARRYSEVVTVTAAIDFAISLGLIAGLIAVIYRYLPAKRLAWQPILWGALVTALLFQLGRWAISYYLARSAQPSAFGAAASFAALLLWLYYSAQIFLFGAEFTACLGGSRVTTASRANHEGNPA